MEFCCGYTWGQGWAQVHIFLSLFISAWTNTSKFLTGFHYSHSSRATDFLSVFYEIAFHKFICDLLTAVFFSHGFSAQILYNTSCSNQFIIEHEASLVSTAVSTSSGYFPCFHTTDFCSLPAAFYHILPLCSSSCSFYFQVPYKGPHFPAITNSFFLHLKLYGTKEHLPPTHLAVYSGCCFNMPLLLPLQCNIFCYHGPKQIIKNPLCLMLRVTYCRFLQEFWDFSPSPLVNS